MGKADLHIHTNASDGELSPEELLKKVSRKGLNTIAITDHDTIDGFLQAREIAEDLDIELITGIEFSAIWNKREIHVLAYAFDEKNELFIQLLASQK